MAEYQFGLPENNPNSELTDGKRPEEDQEQQDRRPVAKNQAAIKRTSPQVPIDPPPDQIVKAVIQDSPPPQYGHALPPTASKTQSLRSERLTTSVSQSETSEVDEDLKSSKLNRPSRPRRSKSNKLKTERAADAANQAIADAVPIAQYYVHQLRRVLFAPSDFFAEMQEEETFSEAAMFMGITLAFCGVMRLLCGDFWALIHFIGNVFVVVTAALFGTYIFKNLEPEQEVDFNIIFSIFAYAQAPQLIAWLKLGIFQFGSLIAAAYSLALCCIAFQQIFGMSKIKSGLIVSGVFMAALSIAWFLHL